MQAMVWVSVGEREIACKQAPTSNAAPVAARMFAKKKRPGDKRRPYIGLYCAGDSSNILSMQRAARRRRSSSSVMICSGRGATRASRTFSSELSFM